MIDTNSIRLFLYQTKRSGFAIDWWRGRADMFPSFEWPWRGPRIRRGSLSGPHDYRFGGIGRLRLMIWRKVPCKYGCDDELQFVSRGWWKTPMMWRSTRSVFFKGKCPVHDKVKS